MRTIPLTDPYPLRREESFTLSIAGLDFVVDCAAAPFLTEPLPANYLSFVGSVLSEDTGPLTIRVSLEIGDLPLLAEGLEEIFKGMGAWSMYRKGDEYYLVLNPAMAGGPECVARFGLDVDEVVVNCGDMAIVEVDGQKMVRNPFVYPLDQLVMMYALAARKGVIVHAAGIDLNGCGYIFPGRSGAGKSTLSHLLGELKNIHLLSDDRIVVRRIADSFSAFGTPWSGEAGIALNRAAPLRGIFFISHASGNSIRPMRPGDALKRLLTVSSVPWFDREVLNHGLSLCEEILSNVPAYELCFRPDSEIVHIFEEFRVA